MDDRIQFLPIVGGIGTHGRILYNDERYRIAYQNLYKVRMSQEEQRDYPVLSKCTDPGFGELNCTDWICLVMYSDLTLTFAGAHRILLGFDGRSNKAHWKRSDFGLPIISGTGSLQINGMNLDNEHLGLGDILLEEYNEATNVFRLQLSHESAQNYYLIGTDIVAGLCGPHLTDLYLSNLIFSNR